MGGGCFASGRVHLLVTAKGVASFPPDPRRGLCPLARALRVAHPRRGRFAWVGLASPRLRGPMGGDGKLKRDLSAT